jgi:hypothetical protein
MTENPDETRHWVFKVRAQPVTASNQLESLTFPAEAEAGASPVFGGSLLKHYGSNQI